MTANILLSTTTLNLPNPPNQPSIAVPLTSMKPDPSTT